MTIGPWFHSPLGIFAGTVLFPPAGLVALWMSRRKVWRKLAWSFAVLVVAILELVFIYGLRLEVTGGVKPLFSFRDRGRHFSTLERDRARQASSEPPVAPPAPTAPVA